ncbi:hypothetical protein CLAIMM_00118 [Cladophialophora immunda]|nr:hypothetical protein CLAIMM_00118 [Cladophialophora immunda]
MGAHLISQRVLKHSEFLIVDRHADYGGVWEANTYPGAACDVPSHAYVMPFSLKADWTRKYAPQKEIKQYYVEIAERHKLRQNTVFNTRVVEARWHQADLIWDVLVEDVTTGKLSRWRTNSIVHAGGQFWKPKYVDIPGRETFKGEQIHTAEWRHDIDLHGKRIALIGTGPSAAQVAPKIQPIARQLNVYQRSATYVMPRGDDPVPGWKKTLFGWVPGLLWLYHMWWYVDTEMSKPMWLSGTKRHQQAGDFALKHLKDQVKDPVVRRKLTPRNQFGCKRILVLDDWYAMFNQPNVELITDKPIRITERGIISKPPHELTKDQLQGLPTGAYDLRNEDPEAVETEREADVIIWGTGFDMNAQGSHFQVYGVNGINLEKVWGDTPRAYYSVGVSKFPNFMLLMGPNAANFWSNIPFLVQVQVKYNCQLVAHIKKQINKGPYGLYIKPEVQSAYNDWIQANMGNIAILSPNCSNYYKNSKSEPTFWSPLNGYDYAWRMAWPKYEDYVQLRNDKS